MSIRLTGSRSNPRTASPWLLSLREEWIGNSFGGVVPKITWHWVTLGYRFCSHGGDSFHPLRAHQSVSTYFVFFWHVFIIKHRIVLFITENVRDFVCSWNEFSRCDMTRQHLDVNKYFCKKEKHEELNSIYMNAEKLCGKALKDFPNIRCGCENSETKGFLWFMRKTNCWFWPKKIANKAHMSLKRVNGIIKHMKTARQHAELKLLFLLGTNLYWKWRWAFLAGALSL